jgi:hypothetical protein
MPILLDVAERHFRSSLGRAVTHGLRIVSSTKFTWSGTTVTGCCAIGAVELDPRYRHVFADLPQGAKGAIADGFDGLPNSEMNKGIDGWHMMGQRLRRAYKPVRA